jgi:hypothetical protein
VVIYVFKPARKFFETIQFFEIFLKYMGTMVRAGAGARARAEIFDKL